MTIYWSLQLELCEYWKVHIPSTSCHILAVHLFRCKSNLPVTRQTGLSDLLYSTIWKRVHYFHLLRNLPMPHLGLYHFKTCYQGLQTTCVYNICVTTLQAQRWTVSQCQRGYTIIRGYAIHSNSSIIENINPLLNFSALFLSLCLPPLWEIANDYIQFLVILVRQNKRTDTSEKLQHASCNQKLDIPLQYDLCMVLELSNVDQHRRSRDNAVSAKSEHGQGGINRCTCNIILGCTRNLAKNDFADFSSWHASFPWILNTSS